MSARAVERAVLFAVGVVIALVLARGIVDATRPAITSIATSIEVQS